MLLEKMALIDCRVATNCQLVKNTILEKPKETKHNKMKYASIHVLFLMFLFFFYVPFKQSIQYGIKVTLLTFK